MDLAELRKREHISASAINDYIECGLHYKFSRIDKLEPEFRSDNLVFGSTIHKVIAHFHQERMIGKIPTVSELHVIFEEHWRNAQKGDIPIKYSKGKDHQTLLEEGKKLLEVYHENFSGEGFEVLAIEEPFSFSIDGLDVPVIGVFDLVEQDPSGTIIVSDFKTSSRGFGTDQIDRNYQLTVYQMGVKANGYGDREVLLRFDCVIKTKQPRFEQHYTARSATDERRAEKKMKQVRDGITKGVFLPNDASWKCSGCEFKKHCEEWAEN